MDMWILDYESGCFSSLKPFSPLSITVYFRFEIGENSYAESRFWKQTDKKITKDHNYSLSLKGSQPVFYQLNYQLDNCMRTILFQSFTLFY